VLIQLSGVNAVRHSFEQSHGQGGASGQVIDAAFSGSGPCDSGAQRGFDGVNCHVREFGAMYAQQECIRVPGGVVTDGEHHAGFGYPVVGRVLADDGVDQQIMNLLMKSAGEHAVRDHHVQPLESRYARQQVPVGSPQAVRVPAAIPYRDDYMTPRPRRRFVARLAAERGWAVEDWG